MRDFIAVTWTTAAPPLGPMSWLLGLIARGMAVPDAIVAGVTANGVGVER
jgi:hypothetical protein